MALQLDHTDPHHPLVRPVSGTMRRPTFRHPNRLRQMAGRAPTAERLLAYLADERIWSLAVRDGLHEDLPPEQQEALAEEAVDHYYRERERGGEEGFRAAVRDTWAEFASGMEPGVAELNEGCHRYHKRVEEGLV